MAAEMKSLESLSPALREPVGRYARQVQEWMGTNVLELTIYGAAAAGQFHPGRHLIHNVLVLEWADLESLKWLAGELPRVRAARIAAPVVLTPDYIRASLDTFPLELLEVQQQHRTIFGDDHFASLTFEPAHVRLQCERELKTILLAMRQALLHSGGKASKITELTEQAGDGILRTLRGLLWLKGHTTATPAADVLRLVEATIKRPLVGVRELLDESARHDWTHFQNVYRDVDALGGLADQW
jgi:hypothetical protein